MILSLWVRAEEQALVRSYRLSLSEVVTVADRGRNDGDSIRDGIRELNRAPFESRFLNDEDQLLHLEPGELGLRGKESVLVYNKTGGRVVPRAKVGPEK